MNLEPQNLLFALIAGLTRYLRHDKDTLNTPT